MLNTDSQGSETLLSTYSANLGNLISRRQAERALRAAAKESALASRVKSEFLTNMSHELRTPLNAIIGFAELIQSAKNTNLKKTQDQAADIANAGHHLLQTINDILDLSKIDNGKFLLERTPQQIGEIVQSCANLIAPAIAEKRQRLVVIVPEGLPPIAVDYLRIKQALLNVLSNACKFTPEGGKIAILVKCQNHTAVTVAVSDTGCGMNAEEIRTALEPFRQVQSGYSRNHQGAGLGLPIARGFILLHGGEFHVTSEPDVGTTVAFTLPIYGEK